MLCQIVLGSLLVVSSVSTAKERVYVDNGIEMVRNYQDKRLTDYGILDVTKAPYSVDSSGVKDSTRAIQEAITDARDARMIVYFPSGKYRVSDTISANQINQNRVAIPSISRRDDFPCILWGGTSGGRAKIVLSDNSPQFSDSQNPKPVISTETDANPNITFNVMIVSLDVDLGKGNAGGIGIDHQGAQGSVTEDVHVFAQGAFAGFRGTSGSGGSASHISVHGGRYGLYLTGLKKTPSDSGSGSQPSPVISHVVLEGQTDKSIFSGTRGPLTLVGASIKGQGIHIKGPHSPWNGALNIVDSVIQYKGDGPVITGDRPLYLSNVYFENAKEIAHLDNAPVLEGVRGAWVHVTEYAASQSPKYPIWVNGIKQHDPVVTIEYGSEPAKDLLETHEWTEKLPSWDNPKVANVKESPYSAIGDGKTDDTQAIQQAINENRFVFLPKGVYRISNTLQLKSDSRLFGIGVHSKIEPIPESPAFIDPKSPSPILAAPDDPEATCVAAFIQLWCRMPGAYAIHWQSGHNSVVRNVRTKPGPWLRGAGPTNHPMIVIDGNGGGRWYNALMHIKFPQGSKHRHVLARGTRESLAFYMLNPEHSAADYMVEFDNVRNANVYAIKSETLGANGPRAITPVFIRNSSNFRIFGHGGNAVPAKGQPMYRIRGCTNFLLANFTYQFYKPGADPSTWFMVEEVTQDGRLIHTPGTENFTLYKRK